MKYYTLRRFLWISLFVGGLIIMSNCKGTSHQNESSEPAAVNKSSVDAGLQDSAKAAVEKSEELEGKKTIPGSDSLKQQPPSHNAPNQAEIDSLKKAKTRTKVESPK
jgi:hypothetical protein